MGINITEIAQKILDNNKNAANVFRKMYDLHYNPNPLDVPFEYIDENGNKVTTTIKNVAGFRKKVWDDVGGALGQFDRVFYVDQTNGDDNNDGSSSAPFKTLSKAVNSVPFGGRGQIYLLSNYVLDSNVDISYKKIRIFIKNGFKLYGKWYVYSGTDRARLYHFNFSGGFLYLYLEQYDNEGEPSQIIIPENDTGKDKETEYIQLLHHTSSCSSICKIEYRNQVDGANVIEVNDGYLFKQYTWSRQLGLVDIRIQGHYDGSKIMINTNNVSNFIDFKGGSANFIWQVDASTLVDQDGNDLNITEHIGGIIKDADSGNPLNLISNINFSD